MTTFRFTYSLQLKLIINSNKIETIKGGETKDIYLSPGKYKLQLNLKGIMSLHPDLLSFGGNFGIDINIKSKEIEINIESKRTYFFGCSVKNLLLANKELIFHFYGNDNQNPLDY